MKPGCLPSEPLHGQSCGHSLIADILLARSEQFQLLKQVSLKPYLPCVPTRTTEISSWHFNGQRPKYQNTSKDYCIESLYTDPANQLFHLLDVMHFLFKQETNGAALNGTDWAWFYCSCVKDEPKLVWVGEKLRENDPSVLWCDFSACDLLLCMKLSSCLLHHTTIYKRKKSKFPF